MVKFLVPQYLYSRQARSLDALPNELLKLPRNLTEVRYKVESIAKRTDEKQNWRTLRNGRFVNSAPET